MQSKNRLHIERLRSCIGIRLPFAFALVSLSCFFCLMKAPSNTIGFLSHLPGKIPSKILLGHSVAATSPLEIPLPARRNRPFSVTVKILTPIIFLFEGRPSPFQHALFPSEVSNSNRSIRRVAAKSRMIRGPGANYVLDCFMAKWQRVFGDHRSRAFVAPNRADLLFKNTNRAHRDVGSSKLFQKELVHMSTCLLMCALSLSSRWSHPCPSLSANTGCPRRRITRTVEVCSLEVRVDP